MHTLDFETKKIEDGGPLLPYPVGCAILYPDGNAKYWAWGHPEGEEPHMIPPEGTPDEFKGNNCTFEEFRQELLTFWDQPILTHNGATFDIEVATHHFNLPRRDPLLTHDTLFAAYLHDPHARSLSLKDLANDWLGIPPDEQQDMYDWIMKHLHVPKSQCGAYISETPVWLSGPYAVGDVVRTKALWDFVAPLIKTMAEPYLRELKLAPILADIQNRGVRCDLERLKADHVRAEQMLAGFDRILRNALNSPNLDVGSDKDLGAALQAAGYKNFMLTPKGKISVSKDSLAQVLEEVPQLKALLRFRAVFATLTSTFMLPWINYATANGGRIHAGYNQVRNPDGFGTRTGRLSSSKPNFQNVPNDFEDLEPMYQYWPEELGPVWIPLMRSYLLPEEGHVWVCGDFKNQEPRIAAHYESGQFMEAFNNNPELDPYQFIVELVNGQLSRKICKAIYLGILYAMGVGTMQDTMKKKGIDLTSSEVSTYRNIIRAGIPDVMELDRECRARFNKGLPIRTMGGRLYYCEPPKDGRHFAYKALNTAVQGSAADQTKEAMIFAFEQLQKVDPTMRLLGTVHDEYSISCPPEMVGVVKAIMNASANALPCDVPMLMDIAVGNNWAEAA